MRKWFFKKKSFFILLLLAPSVTSCALFFGDDEPVKKDSKVQYPKIVEPFKSISSAGGADIAWQSDKTGNTISGNSTCIKSDGRDLKALEQSILQGIDNLKILSEKSITIQELHAERVLAEGKADGVPIQADLVIIKKNDCTYDLDYIATKKAFEEEHLVFENFINGFKIP